MAEPTLPVPTPVQVEMLSAAPNALFTEEQRACVLFLRFSAAVPCGACGKRSRHHWTMRVSFQAQAMPGLVCVPLGPPLLPLAPVCRDHPLASAALPPTRRARASRAQD